MGIQERTLMLWGIGREIGQQKIGDREMAIGSGELAPRQIKSTQSVQWAKAEVSASGVGGSAISRGSAGLQS